MHLCYVLAEQMARALWEDEEIGAMLLLDTLTEKEYDY